MERLTVEDQVLLWPDALWPQEVGAVAVLDGGVVDSDGSLRIESVRSLVAARIHRVPRLRQILYVPRRPLGPPLWVDDATFDVAEHVRSRTVPTPGGDTELLSAVEHIMRRRLDRSRPLWEMWLLPGLSGGRVGLFLRLHHVIADGLAAISTFGAFLDPEPRRTDAPPPRWTPKPRPGSRDLLADNLRTRLNRGGAMIAALRHPVAAAHRSGSGWRAMRALLRAEPDQGTSLDRVVGPDRRLAVLRTRLDVVSGIGHAYDATVNDVLLTVVGGGVRGLFRGRGDPVDELVLPMYVPATLRRGQFDQARGNMIGQFVVPVPVGLTDPAERLRRVAAQTRRRKSAPVPSIGNLLGSRAGRRMLLKVLDKHPVSVTTADLMGPSGVLYFADALVGEVFPVLPLISKVSVAVGALSYAGALGITVVVDADAVPDLEVFVQGAQAELDALTRGVSETRRAGYDAAAQP